MEDEIFDIITDLLRYDISKTEAIDKLLVLSNVSQRSELLFAFREWLHDKGFYPMSPGLRKRQVEMFLKSK